MAVLAAIVALGTLAPAARVEARAAVAAVDGTRPGGGLAGQGDLQDLPSVFTAGTAGDYGSTGPVLLSGPLRDLVRTSTGRGYWMLGTDGGVFTYGDAAFLGSTGGIVLNRPAVAMAATTSSNGYWFVASDGGVFTFGDAAFLGSGGGSALPSPAVALSAKPDGTGYWLLLSDGTVVGYGSASRLPLAASRVVRGVPSVDIQSTPTGRGYWVVEADGQVVPYGDAAVLQPTVSVNPGGKAVALAATPDGTGVWVATTGRIRPPGTATAMGPYTFLVVDSSGAPGRWNPCSGPIPFLFNPRLAPPGAEQLVIEAFEYLQGITGLHFTYGGPTTVDPRTARVDGSIVVGWVEPFDAVGRGGSQYRHGSVGLVALNGSVFLNADYNDDLTVSWRGGAWGPVLLHEIGHVLNLGHVDDPQQLMNPVNTGQSDFGSGDLAGLQLLGASQGCA